VSTMAEYMLDADSRRYRHTQLAALQAFFAELPGDGDVGWRRDGVNVWIPPSHAEPLLHFFETLEDEIAALEARTEKP